MTTTDEDARVPRIPVFARPGDVHVLRHRVKRKENVVVDDVEASWPAEFVLLVPNEPLNARHAQDDAVPRRLVLRHGS